MIVVVDKELKDVFPRFLKSREEDLMKLEAALEKKDFEVMRNIGHKISGNAGGYGLAELGEFAKNLENAASDRKFDVCRAMIQSMRVYVDEIEAKFV